MPLGDSDTRAKLIDQASLPRPLPALKALGQRADILRQTRGRLFAA